MNIRRPLVSFSLVLASAALTPRLAHAQGAPAAPAAPPAPAETTAPAAPPAASDQDRAKEHIDRGTVFYNMQDWPAAIREYKEAYAIDPRPATLWSLAQAQRLSGDCASAILSYKAFIRTASATQGAAAESLIGECERDLADKEKKKAEAAAAAPPKPAQAPTTAPPPAPAPKVAHTSTGAATPWYSDVLGGVLFVGGAAGLGVGSYFLATGNADMRATASAPTYRAYDLGVDAARPKQIGGLTGVVAGCALMGLGVVRYVVVARRGHGPEVGAASVAVTPGGAVAGWAGRF